MHTLVPVNEALPEDRTVSSEYLVKSQVITTLAFCALQYAFGIKKDIYPLRLNP